MSKEYVLIREISSKQLCFEIKTKDFDKFKRCCLLHVKTGDIIEKYQDDYSIFILIKFIFS